MGLITELWLSGLQGKIEKSRLKQNKKETG
jgi:hypothetical protein